MKHLALAAAALATAIAAPASAESWFELASTAEVVGYGDADSVTVTEGMASARVMLGLRSPMGKDGNIAFLVSSVRFSCSEASYFVDKVSGLDATRNLVTALPGSREWKPVSQGSLHASFREFACGKVAATPIGDPFAASARFWNKDEAPLDSGAHEVAGQFYMG